MVNLDSILLHENIAISDTKIALFLSLWFPMPEEYMLSPDSKFTAISLLVLCI